MEARHDENSAGVAPRLRIAHLLGWTVASAVGFAAYRGITPRLGLGASWAVLGVYDSVMGLALGTILSGVGIMGYRRWRGGMPYPSLPGHWLLLLGLVAAVANGVAIAVFNFLIHLYYPPSKWPPGTVYLPKVFLVQFLISNNPDVIGVYHQAIGWGDRGRGGPGTRMASPPPALVALARGLRGIRPGRCDPLRRAHPVPDPGPILPDAETDQLLVPPIGPRLREGHPAGGIRDDGCACLGCPEPCARRWASLGWGRDLAHHRRPSIRHVPADFLTASG